MSVLPDFPVTAHNSPLPVPFEVPPVNPSPQGLYVATQWVQDDGAPRWLPSGVQVRPGGNYGGGSAFGVWGAPWCVSPDDLGPEDIKTGTRPALLDPFEPMTVWASDACDLTAPSRAEVEQRAAQILRLEEQVAVEREFAERLKLDAADLGAPISANDLQWAVASIEAAFARTNTLGFIHASPQWAAYAAQAQLLVRSGGGYLTPLGHRWVFGGGYTDGLENTLIATSQPFGWRDEPQLRTTMDTTRNEFIAIAERSVTIGYEALIAAVEITP